MIKTISILGSTGSIGCSTLDVIDENNDRFANGLEEYEFQIIALTANNAVDDLIKQAKKYRPFMVAINNESHAEKLKSALSGYDIKIAFGARGIIEAASLQSEYLMAAIVGYAGMQPTIEAAKRGAKILLANKECLVCAGEIFLKTAHDNGAKILPVDSEHNAIFQVLDNSKRVEKLILTASGGPFLKTPFSEFDKLTPKQAIAHPNWQMGAKISVDSASFMNKGLELIEASYLFGLNENRIDVLVHPQSIIHSMVAYEDGSVLAQMGTPDMRIPISYGLSWPKRMNISAQRLDLAQISKLEFLNPDLEKFRALVLARNALNEGGAMPTIYNCANEIAVEAFLNFNVFFNQIPIIVEQTMDKYQRSSNNHALSSLDDVVDADKCARSIALEIIRKLATN